ncbi:MAG: hypothetical protein Tsb0020_09440 [Haliangiales bacterium]
MSALARPPYAREHPHANAHSARAGVLPYVRVELDPVSEIIYLLARSHQRDKHAGPLDGVREPRRPSCRRGRDRSMMAGLRCQFPNGKTWKEEEINEFEAIEEFPVGEASPPQPPAPRLAASLRRERGRYGCSGMLSRPC